MTFDPVLQMACLRTERDLAQDLQARQLFVAHEVNVIFEDSRANDMCKKACNVGSDALSVQLSGQAAPISRASSRSSLARPYIWRFTSLSLVTWPSV